MSGGASVAGPVALRPGGMGTATARGSGLLRSRRSRHGDRCRHGRAGPKRAGAVCGGGDRGGPQRPGRGARHGGGRRRGPTGLRASGTRRRWTGVPICRRRGAVSVVARLPFDGVDTTREPPVPHPARTIRVPLRGRHVRRAGSRGPRGGGPSTSPRERAPCLAARDGEGPSSAVRRSGRSRPGPLAPRAEVEGERSGSPLPRAGWCRFAAPGG